MGQKELNAEVGMWKVERKSNDHGAEVIEQRHFSPYQVF